MERRRQRGSPRWRSVATARSRESPCRERTRDRRPDTRGRGETRRTRSPRTIRGRHRSSPDRENALRRRRMRAQAAGSNRRAGTRPRCTEPRRTGVLPRSSAAIRTGRPPRRPRRRRRADEGARSSREKKPTPRRKPEGSPTERGSTATRGARRPAREPRRPPSRSCSPTRARRQRVERFRFSREALPRPTHAPLPGRRREAPSHRSPSERDAPRPGSRTRRPAPAQRRVSTGCSRAIPLRRPRHGRRSTRRNVSRERALPEWRGSFRRSTFGGAWRPS